MTNTADAKTEQLERRCLAAAYKALFDLLGNQPGWLRENIPAADFMDAMDSALAAIVHEKQIFFKEEKIPPFIDSFHICASALHALVTEADIANVNPCAASVLHMLAFSDWMIDRNVR